MDLNKIKDPSFLMEMNIDELNELAYKIRQFIIQSVSKTGGHLSSNLGIVELTIALHYVFNSPKDKIFFDVGHQSYVHKILTGRAKQFPTLRQFNGLSGFQKRCESKHDVWEAGHSSTALSAAVAMAIARDLNHEYFDVIPVIGDGAVVGGESLEALNHLGSIQNKVILILNDNQMSISKSTGAMNNFLNNIRISNTYNRMKDDYRTMLQKGKLGEGVYKATKYLKDFVKHVFLDDTIFEDFGMDYLGPIDGHNIGELIRVLNIAKTNKKSVVVHVVTEKGKGYSYAENDKEGKWHGTPPFNVKTGNVLTSTNKKSWSSIVSDQVFQWMKIDKDVTAITPAMMKGSAMDNLFKVFPERCFDVGIAEEHAMTFAAGLSISKKKPFISVYSSFIQRAYDQINHDIARMKLPCLCSIDRAGIVGEDGPTHHGVFDIGFLTPIPNIVYFAPKDAKELRTYVNTCFTNFNKPYFLRIPRGSIDDHPVDYHNTLKIGTWTIECHEENYELTIICYGENVTRVKNMIEENHLPIRLINARFIKPIDYNMVHTIFKNDEKPIIVYETVLKTGSLGSILLTYCNENRILRSFEHIAIQDHFSKQGTVNEILEDEHVDIKSLLLKCEELLNGKKEN